MLSKAFLKEVEVIHNDTKSGAAKIAEDCLLVLKRECLRKTTQLKGPILKTAVQLLLDTHPMATIENALLPVYVRLMHLIKSGKISNGDPKAVIEMIFTTHRDQIRLSENYTINSLVDVLRDKSSILTFSHSSTVIKALLQLARDGDYDKEIFILESRPLKEGERTAYTLATAGFKKTHLGIDLAINDFSKIAEMAILGADMIHSNGYILNKIGSATIAKLFHLESKEVIIGASRSKICLRSFFDQDDEWKPAIPHRNPREVSSISSPNLFIWNKYFEIIKPEFISLLVMDQYRFNSPIKNSFNEFLKNDDLLSKQIETIRDLWYDIDFSIV